MVPGLPRPFWEPPPTVGQITELRFFEKINFLCFGGPQKTFLAPKNFFESKKPYLALETSLLGGVILLKLFDLGHHSGDIQC